MSSTTRFKSQAPLLISCTLPLATVAQPPAGSFRERAATTYSLQQSCPPDFPMPDIRKRYCAGQIDLPSFAPVWLPSCFGWNRPLIYGPVPAEKVSWRLQKMVAATPRPRKTPDLRARRLAALPSMARFRSAWIGINSAPAPSQLTSKEVACLNTAENQQ